MDRRSRTWTLVEEAQQQIGQLVWPLLADVVATSIDHGRLDETPRHHLDNFDTVSHHNQMPRSSHTQQAGATATRGRPRDEALSDAIIAAAEQLLRQVGYARMSLRSVAEAAGTTVPSLLRRYPDKATLATAVVDSLRVDPLTVADAPPRDRALALLENFDSNLRRPNSIALLSTLLAEERATPQLIARFRTRLAGPRRQALRHAIENGIAAGDLAPHLDPDVAAAMLIGSFYARYISHGSIPRGWPSTVLSQLWPER